LESTEQKWKEHVAQLEVYQNELQKNQQQKLSKAEELIGVIEVGGRKKVREKKKRKKKEKCESENGKEEKRKKNCKKVNEGNKH
jgi:hypothetical protein